MALAPMSIAQVSEVDFPYTVMVRRADNHEFVWGVTMLRFHAWRELRLYVPPVAEWVKAPVEVYTITGWGYRTIEGPFKPK